MLNEIFLAFIPIFVAVDPIGLLPLFVGLTQRVAKKEKRKIIVQSVATALSLAIAFIVLGKWVFRVMGITVWDFMIAGGVILLCLSISDLLQPWKERPDLPEEMGAVPLGTPLIVGPAVLTTSLIMIDQHGVAATVISVVLNICLVGGNVHLVRFFDKDPGEGRGQGVIQNYGAFSGGDRGDDDPQRHCPAVGRRQWGADSGAPRGKTRGGGILNRPVPCWYGTGLVHGQKRKCHVAAVVITLHDSR